jgi:hypothetical protein
VKEKGAGATGERVDIGARCEGRVSGKGLGDVVVCAIHIIVFAGQDTVEPVQHVLLDRHRSDQ